ncbi:amidohydrolase [Neptunomonas phycophila]|jgi:omega-amidase|uniref:amidohydrolase n=1 Tax=Neptunomonas phycophila TaxID=1572645 RepID=UPI0026E2409B|nr:amidohydrolase [Neptunomonas phycophila]MDO6467732.1 amidohydrolase [Neptunomonas phycophila]
METLNSLRVSLVQTPLHWENAAENRTQFTALLAPLAGQTDLVVLPEMFTTGFMMQPEVQAEPADGPTLAWMKQQACQLDAAICGSIAVEEGGQYFNRFLLVTPQAHVMSYDKRHLFRMGSEPDHYTAGQERKVFEYRGWRILPQVCYDLRFPVFIRNRNDYDLAIFVANWPAARARVWRTLLEARALENQSYVVGVNRIGQDGMNLDYRGDSMLIDYSGTALIDHSPNEAFVETTTINRDRLNDFKAKFPAWMDGDEFTLAT